MKKLLGFDGKRFEIHWESTNEGYRLLNLFNSENGELILAGDEKSIEVSDRQTTKSGTVIFTGKLLKEGRFERISFSAQKLGALTRLIYQGKIFEFSNSKRRVSGKTSTQELAHGTVSSPMPGKVLKVMVGVGDHVEKGDPLLVVEAMKMEHSLKAPLSAVVESIKTSEGEQVTKGQILLELNEFDINE